MHRAGICLCVESPYTQLLDHCWYPCVIWLQCAGDVRLGVYGVLIAQPVFAEISTASSLSLCTRMLESQSTCPCVEYQIDSSYRLVAVTPLAITNSCRTWRCRYSTVCSLSHCCKSAGRFSPFWVAVSTSKSSMTSGKASHIPFHCAVPQNPPCLPISTVFSITVFFHQCHDVPWW